MSYQTQQRMLKPGSLNPAVPIASASGQLSGQRTQQSNALLASMVSSQSHAHAYGYGTLAAALPTQQQYHEHQRKLQAYQQQVMAYYQSQRAQQHSAAAGAAAYVPLFLNASDSNSNLMYASTQAPSQAQYQLQYEAQIQAQLQAQSQKYGRGRVQLPTMPTLPTSLPAAQSLTSKMAAMPANLNVSFNRAQPPYHRNTTPTRKNYEHAGAAAATLNVEKNALNATLSHATAHAHTEAGRAVAPERYATLKKVGQGTFADIWEVYDRSSHFALKTLRKGKCLGADGKLDASKYRRYSGAIVAEGNRLLRLNARDPECRAQLVRCREMLQPRAVSPNLAASIAGTDGKNPLGPCVVLELLGVSLIHFEHLRKRNKVGIPLKTVRFIALQLLNVMSFLHGVGDYIHADLKPENVVISLTHSVSGRLLSNAHPDIKVVDLGNALAVGREVSTFEVQSLHYRAPELLFGNEVTAAIDLWSIGCILLELISDSEYCKGLEAAKQAKLKAHVASARSKGHALYHFAVFASRDNAQLAASISKQLSALPAYFYNEFASFHFKHYCSKHSAVRLHCDANYERLRKGRQQMLIERMRPDAATRAKLAQDAEFSDFLDLITRLLDPNPATRFTSEDASQHRFCIGLEYVKHDERVHELLCEHFDSAFPRVSISSDAARQRRLSRQLQRFQAHRAAKAANAKVPRPSAKAITRRSSHRDELCADPAVLHSRAVCLVHGCCGNPTLLDLEREIADAHAHPLRFADDDVNSPSALSAVSPAMCPQPPRKRMKLYQ